MPALNEPKQENSERRPNVPDQLDVLASVTEQTEIALCNLIDRLENSGVLSPPKPESAENPTAEEAFCALAENIRDNTDRIKEMRDTIRRILGRLEI